MRLSKFVRNSRRTTLQVGLSSFGSSFLPIVNLGLKFFQMRRSRVDLFEQLTRLSIACENGQRSDVGFLSCEHFKLVVLVRRFLFRPGTRRVARDCFNSPNTRCDRGLAHDSKWPDLSCCAHMRAATKFHRITIERFRFAANLQKAYGIAVFFAKELLNVG